MNFEEGVATDLAYGFGRHAEFYVNTYKKWDEKSRADWRSRGIDKEPRRID